MPITNLHGISPVMLVWLMDDTYDYNDDPNTFSVTTLMKPIRQIVLSRREYQAREVDISDLIPSKLGSTIHDAIDKSWDRTGPQSLTKFGTPQSVVDRMLVNPDPASLPKDCIPIYKEIRLSRKFGKYTVSGKFDFIFDGQIQDHKSTSAWQFVYGGRDDEYKTQMNSYRVLDEAYEHPRITQDTCVVNFVFTDWQSMLAKTVENYPQIRVETKTLALPPIEETKNWIERRLELIEHFMDTPEAQLPECSEEELWMPKPKFKYFSDPEKAKTGGRSTKNFSTLIEANAFAAEKGKGIVVSEIGKPKRCEYCAVFHACSQKDKYQ